jgi:multidrug efflux pump subunit AcrB
MEGLDTITSSSRENVSSIALQFVSNVDPEKAKNDVKSIVDTVTNLPQDAKTPTVIKLDFENQPIWSFTVISQEDIGSLTRFAEDLKKRIENSPKVDRVVTAGITAQEIQVIIDPVKIKNYGINPLLLSQTISKATNSYPAGSLNTSSSTFSLSIDREVMRIEDIRNIRITSQGQVLNLSDIATIMERQKPEGAHTYYADNKTDAVPTVQFFIYKTKSANIDEAEQAAEKIVTATVADYNNRFTIISVQNAAKQISDQFSELVGEFRSTIILVFINLLLFLGLRQAFISSLTVPLTFLASITVLNILGQTLNFLTLFAFLIALGLLIDDTIVTVAAMTRYYATKRFSAAETGVLVWRDFIVPLWSTTITTVWAFIPLLIATGIIGEFIKPIPIVVTTTMLSSTSIAVLITLPLMIITLKPQLPQRVQILLKILGIIFLLATGAFLLPKNPLFPAAFLVYIGLLALIFLLRDYWRTQASLLSQRNASLNTVINNGRRILDHGLINVEYMSEKYMYIIDRVLRSQSLRRTVIFIIVTFAVVAYLLVPLGFVKNEFFPKSDAETLYVSVSLPSGTNLDTTTAEAKRLAADLRKTPYVNFVVTDIGSQLDTQGERSESQGSVLFTLHLPPEEERPISSIDIAQRLREKYEGYTKGTLAVQELSGGPPAGSDLQIKLLGDDLGIIDQYADNIVSYLNKQQGITNVQKSIKAGTSKLIFIPDKNKIAEAGLTTDAIALWLRTLASGFTLDTIKISDKEQDIVFRFNSGTLTPEDIGSITIPTQTTGIPLLSLGTIRLSSNPTVITREGGKRSLSVSAAVTQGYNIADKNKDLEKFASTLSLPQGYSWQTGGVNEENQKSVNSIFQAMALSFLLILVTMVIEFGSYRQAAIVMLTIPLAIPGVFYVFGLLGIPLSFPALIGVLALFGIVVTNAIVVVEKINDNRKHGMNLHDAIVDASGSRLEPILLTSITSILGLLPITIADPLWRGLGGAIIAGLLFSGLVKLFFVPVMYYMWYQKDTPRVSTRSA